MILPPPQRQLDGTRTPRHRETALGLVTMALLTGLLLGHVLDAMCGARSTWPCRGAPAGASDATATAATDAPASSLAPYPPTPFAPAPGRQVAPFRATPWPGAGTLIEPAASVAFPSLVTPALPTAPAIGVPTRTATAGPGFVTTSPPATSPLTTLVVPTVSLGGATPVRVAPSPGLAPTVTSPGATAAPFPIETPFGYP